MWQKSTQLSYRSRGFLQLDSGDEDLARGKVAKASGVIGVEMGHRDPAHIGRVKAKPSQGRNRLVVLVDPLA